MLLRLAVAAGLLESHRLRAVHVNHGLQADAELWASRCQQLCRQWRVPIDVIEVQLGPGSGPEDRARRARYRAFEQLLEQGDGLLLAHHADDQAETLLLRLLRGSGVRGLAAMPDQRQLGAGLLLRPLLDIERPALEHYARQEGLRWVDDPSNQSLEFDRNYLRHQVMPVLKQRWPAITRAMLRSARFCAEAEDLNRQLAAIDLRHCGRVGAAGPGLAIQPLAQLPRNRQVNLLRYWLHQAAIPLPDERVLRRILDEALPARRDAEPLVAWSDYQVRRFQGCLYHLDQRWQAPVDRCRWRPDKPLQLDFGVLTATVVTGGGLRLPAGGTLEVGFRQGGERLRLPGRAGSRSLKKLLQVAAVPPWQRSLLPLIYVDGELAAVLGLAAEATVLDGFQSDDQQPGLRLHWAPC